MSPSAHCSPRLNPKDAMELRQQAAAAAAATEAEEVVAAAAQGTTASIDPIPAAGASVVVNALTQAFESDAGDELGPDPTKPPPYDDTMDTILPDAAADVPAGVKLTKDGDSFSKSYDENQFVITFRKNVPRT